MALEESVGLVASTDVNTLNLVHERGKSLMYSPDIRVYIESGTRAIEISNDIVDFSLTRNVNAVSTFNCTINNARKKYQNKMQRMARIAVYLKNQRGWKQAFSGYLDKVPYRQVTPGNVEISASCSLKRLKYTFWDPYSTDAQNIFPFRSDLLQVATVLGGVGLTNATGQQGNATFNGSFVRPVDAQFPVTSPFGPRVPPPTAGGGRGSSNHGGIDFGAPKGTPIKAAAGGRVSVSRFGSTGGHFVEIDHGGGVATRYLHMDSAGIPVGTIVSAGDVVGPVGTTGNSSGPHLHFEVRVNGTAVDPQPYLDGSTRLTTGAVTNQGQTVPGASLPSGTNTVITTVDGNPVTEEVEGPQYASDAAKLLEQDSGAALAIDKLLTEVVHWNPRHIQIQNIPTLFKESLNRVEVVGDASPEVVEFMNILLSGPERFATGTANIGGANYGPSQGGLSFAADLIKQTWPVEHWETAFAVMMAESSGNPRAINFNTNSSVDYGLFQINTIHRNIINALPNGTDSLFEPEINVRVAKQIWDEAGRGGRDPWSPWSAYTAGRHLKFLPDAREALGANTTGQGGTTGTQEFNVANGTSATAVDASSVGGTPGGNSGANVATFVDLCLAQNGDRYEWGAGRKVSDPNPQAFDCSGLVFWACAQMGIDIPGQSTAQYRHCLQAQSLMSVEEAINTRGALLFRIGVTAIDHVAVSLGDGTTIEARSTDYGVGIFNARGRPFNFGGWIPGLSTQGRSTAGQAFGGAFGGTGGGLIDPLALQNPDITINLNAPDTESNPNQEDGGVSSFVSRSDGLIVGSPISAFNIAWRTPANTVESLNLQGERAFLNDEDVLSSVAELAGASLRDFMSAPNGDFIAFFPDRFGLHGKEPVVTLKDIELINFRIDISDEMLKTHVGIAGDIDAPGTGVDLPDWTNSKGIATIENRSLLALVLGKEPNEVFPDEFLNLFGMRPLRKAMPNIRLREWEILASIHEFQTAWSEQFISNVEITFIPEIMPGMRVELENHDLRFYVESVTHSGSRSGGFTTTMNISSPTDAQNNLISLELGGIDIEVEAPPEFVTAASLATPGDS